MIYIKNKEKAVRLMILGIFLVSMILLARGTAQYTMSTSTGDKKRCVVIDPGHGGLDPGKVGINGALEKDINLEIAKMVKEFLEAEDIRVIMTRESAEGLYDSGASNKKVDDMKKRIVRIEESAPDAVVSIHQNSYHEESVSGPQAFYYGNSIEGKAMAEILQEQIIKGIKPGKERSPKANSSYYLLKKTSRPIVIVECGFLSNSEEASKLCTQLYQEKMAWNIHMGIMRYLNGRE